MKKLVVCSLVAGGLALAVFLVAPTATASFTASIDCDFVSSGRGVCEASPQGSGYSYSWFGSGAGVANRNAAFTSAACGGTFSTITVTVTHTSGASDSATTSAACP